MCTHKQQLYANTGGSEDQRIALREEAAQVQRIMRPCKSVRCKVMAHYFTINTQDSNIDPFANCPLSFSFPVKCDHKGSHLNDFST